jgi:hypothetical protein
MATSRRQTTRRLVSVFRVVFDGIPTFFFECAVLCLRRDDWRFDARRRFLSSCSVTSWGWSAQNDLSRRCDALRRLFSIGRIVTRSSYWFNFQFVADFAALSVATLGVGFPTSCPMASRGSSSLIVASCSRVARICVPTLGVGLSQSLHMVFLGFYWLHLHFGFGVAMLGFFFPTLCQMLSRRSSTLNLASFTLSRCTALVFRRRVGSRPWASIAKYGV